MDKSDRVLGFTLITGKRDGLTVETNRGRTFTVTARRFQPVSRGARGKLMLKRGYLAKVLREVSELKPLKDEDEEEGAVDLDAEPTTGEASAEPSGDAADSNEADVTEDDE